MVKNIFIVNDYIISLQMKNENRGEEVAESSSVSQLTSKEQRNADSGFTCDVEGNGPVDFESTTSESCQLNTNMKTRLDNKYVLYLFACNIVF